MVLSYKNVELVQKANVYFGGNVTSRNFIDEDGVTKSLGVILPGEYHFNTADAEHMLIIAGKAEVLLDGLESNWETFEAGEYFEVPANSGFEIKVDEVTDYCCTFLKA